LCTIVFNELLTKKPTTVAYENNEQKIESVYSKRIRAGKRRTYFFDVRATRSNDYFLTITESRKRFNDNGYDRHKIFLYKEDFNKFMKALGEAVDYVKTDLMPDFDFDAFNHDNYDENAAAASVDLSSVEVEAIVEVEAEEPVTADLSAELSEAEVVTTTGHRTEEVDKW
jgi:hypothetical protein